MDADRVKHLELIQGVITRMNSNSFQLKGWMVTLVSAMLAVYASVGNEYFILIAVFPAIVFWMLDSYYLMQERKFRGLYRDVASGSETPGLSQPFAMRPDLYVGGSYSLWSSMFSVTIASLYVSIIGFLVGLYVIMQYVIMKEC